MLAMRVAWLGMTVAAVTLLAAYLVFALLLGSTLVGFDVRIRHGYLLTLATAAVVAAGLAAARRQGRVSDRVLRGMLLGSVSILVSLLAVDTVVDLHDKRQTAAALADEARDGAIPARRLYPPMFYPTAKNFTIYKPGFQSAGAVYGDLYAAEFRRSPTLMRSVLERRWVATSIDANGFREVTALGDARVLALGDSFVNNPSLTQELAWPRVLASLIGEPVYSLGVHDASPAQEVWLLEHVLTTLRPRNARRVIWMIFEGNDLENRYDAEADLTPRLFGQTLIGALSAGIPELVRDGSVLSRLLGGGFRLRRSAAADDAQVDDVTLASLLWRSARFGNVLVFPPYLERAAMPESYVSGHPNRGKLEAAFGEMKRLAAAHGLDVTVVLAPSFPRLYAAAFGRAAAVSAAPHFLRLVERAATDGGLPTVNLADLMRPYAERELLYFRDDTHWNERGNRVAAELMARHAFGR
jgi:hypothetical protein